MKIIDGVLKEYDGDSKNMVIPDGVKAVRDLRFKTDSTELESLYCPDSLEEIDFKCFFGCSNLSTVRFGKNIRHLGPSAFHSCQSLKKIYLPKSIEQIDAWSFDDVEEILFEGSIWEAYGLTSCWMDKLKRITCLDCNVDFSEGHPVINELYYNGTKAEWKKEDPDCWVVSHTRLIHCNDGNVKSSVSVESKEIEKTNGSILFKKH